MAGLTVKQQRFVDSYNGNATEAARLAGYKGNDSTLCVVGGENLRKPYIIAAIKAREDKRRAKAIATREQRQIFWTKVMRGKVEGVATRDRLRASELLGKAEGDFLDRTEVSGPGGGPIQTRMEIIQELLDSIDGASRGLPAPVSDD